MSWKEPKAYLAAAALCLVVLVFLQDLERTSPGPLSTPHAGLERLAGASGCRVCHGGFRSKLADGCAECHSSVTDSIRLGQGLHGRIVERPEECAACHVEHHGDEVPLSGDAAFQVAGFESRALFSHEPLGLRLAGRHTELSCIDCHPLADAKALKEGERRFLGAEFSCEACHEDVHEGRIARDCAECHDQEHAFDEARAFVHADEDVLAGAHEGLSCGACHAADSPYSVETVARIDSPIEPRDCGACHDSPHSPAFDAAHIAAAAATGVPACESCHLPAHRTFREARPLVTAEKHAPAGLESAFELRTPHANLECESCHAASPAPWAERFPGRDPEQCTQCHADPHEGQFERSPHGKTGCLGCHSATSFTRSTFDSTDHAATAFPLEGAHLTAACRDCHHAPRGSTIRFVGLSTACTHCHEDVHGGALTELNGEAVGCSTCHGFERFQPSVFDVTQHRRTGFELKGSHEAVACFDCHSGEHGPDLSFGKAERDCVTCHVDVHRGSLGTTSLPRTSQGVTDCAQCHRASVFTELAAGFDHAATCGFSIDGAHALLTCAECHGRAALPDASGRTLGHIDSSEGTASSCVTCHVDAHGGGFDGPGRPTTVGGRRGCERCHTTASFTPLRPGAFDHDSFTDFALDGVHAALDCRECHVGSSPEPSPTVADTQGRLPAARGRACASCHEDPHVGQFNRGGPADCRSCHESTPGWKASRFDHALHSRFTIDDQHAQLDCGACHKVAKLVDGRSAVRYRPLGTTCADCHGPSAGGRRSEK